MSKAVKYYLLAALSVIVINVICLFVARRLSSNVSAFPNHLVNVMYWAVIALCLVQTVIFLISHYKRLYPRFFIVFTGVYAFVFLMIYSLIVYNKLKDWESLRGFMKNAGTLKGFGLSSCFIGDHTWLVIPAVLQAVMLILLYRQRKQASSKVVD